MSCRPRRVDPESLRHLRFDDVNPCRRHRRRLQALDTRAPIGSSSAAAAFPVDAARAGNSLHPFIIGIVAADMSSIGGVQRLTRCVQEILIGKHYIQTVVR